MTDRQKAAVKGWRTRRLNALVKKLDASGYDVIVIDGEPFGISPRAMPFLYRFVITP